MSVKPGEILTGDIDLRYVIDPNALKQSDVLLFWAYQSPGWVAYPSLDGRLGGYPAAKVDGAIRQLSKHPHSAQKLTPEKPKKSGKL